jgi:MraZ protein
MRLPFLGRWICTIDAKRRLTLPAKVREILELEEGPYLVTTVGHKGCLLVVPHARWEELTPDLLRDTFQGDQGAQRLRGAFARYGNLCRPDASGRITLTEEQMRVAGLGKQAVVFGNFSRIELWEPERFEDANPAIREPEEHDRLAAQYLGRAEAGEVRS